MTNNDKGMVGALRAMIGQLNDDKLKTALVRVLNGEDAQPKQTEDKNAIRQEILSGEEAAKVLGLTRRSVQGLAKVGAITRAVLPGRKRGFGYTRRSVEALATGGAA